jgi:hypothetical protein
VQLHMTASHAKKLFLRNPGADGIYVQDGGWQTARVVAMLEADLRFWSSTRRFAKRGKFAGASTSGRSRQALGAC